MRKVCLCIGSARSGTTWLYKNLKAVNPSVLPKNEKEISYWNRRQVSAQAFEKFYQNDQNIMVDISTEYVRYPDKIMRVRQFYNDVKILFFYRDPYDKAISLYFYYKKMGGAKSFREFSHTAWFKDQVFVSKNLQRVVHHFQPENVFVCKFSSILSDSEAVFSLIPELIFEENISPIKQFVNEKVHARKIHRVRILAIIGYKIYSILRHKLRLNWLCEILKFSRLINSLFFTDTFDDDSEFNEYKEILDQIHDVKVELSRIDMILEAVRSV